MYTVEIYRRYIEYIYSDIYTRTTKIHKPIMSNFKYFILFYFVSFLVDSKSPVAACDVARKWQVTLQDPATPIMEGIINFHSTIMFFLIIIGVFVCWLLFRCLFFYNESKNSVENIDNFTHSTSLEIVWTLVPAFILLIISFPSFALLYSMDDYDSENPAYTIRVVGHQWYWSYELDCAIGAAKWTRLNPSVSYPCEEFAPYSKSATQKEAFLKMTYRFLLLKRDYNHYLEGRRFNRDNYYASTAQLKTARIKLSQSLLTAKKIKDAKQSAIRKLLLNHVRFYKLTGKVVHGHLHPKKSLASLDNYYNAWHEHHITHSLKRNVILYKYLEYLMYRKGLRYFVTKPCYDRNIALRREALEKFARAVQECYLPKMKKRHYRKMANVPLFFLDALRFRRALPAIIKAKIPAAGDGLSKNSKNIAYIAPTLESPWSLMICTEVFRSLKRPQVTFDSYMIDESDLLPGQYRLLEVDNRLYVPINTDTRVLITSADVLHSWAVPSLGIKIDACPGRMNEATLRINRIGTFYGQCSEICGVNHGFMPIVVQGCTIDKFLEWRRSLVKNS